MIYLTGDIHGDIRPLENFIEKNHLTGEDVIIVLGDAALNYMGNEKGDKERKLKLSSHGVPVFCIHGNHEMRPQSIQSYIEKEWHGGTAYVEEDVQNLFFAKDGEVYDLDGKKAIAIGGAYSIDKWYRLQWGYQWFSDEQPSEEIKERVIDRLSVLDWKVDIVLSHTCPRKYIPHEAMLGFIDQKSVENATEQWLDEIEDRLAYESWYCGHWHIDKRIDRMHFLKDSFECIGD